MISADVSQVGVTHFLLFNIFYHFTFPFILLFLFNTPSQIFFLLCIIHVELTHDRSNRPEYGATVVSEHLEVPWMSSKWAVLGTWKSIAPTTRVNGARMDTHMALP